MSIYIIIFFIYYIYSRKNGIKKNEKIKLNPPKIERFVISNDFEDNEEEDNNKEINKKVNIENNKENKIIIQVEKKVTDENREKKSIDELLVYNLEEKKYKIKKYKHSIKNISRNDKLHSIRNTNNSKQKKVMKMKI